MSTQKLDTSVHGNIIITQSGNNPNIHQVMKENQEVCYPYSGILFSHKKEAKYCYMMNPENVMLSGRSQMQKAAYYMTHLYEMSRRGKSKRQKKC